VTDDEVREWVRGRLVFEAWLRALHAARDEQVPTEERIGLVAPPAPGATTELRRLRSGTTRSEDAGDGQAA
jgi:hypothetical protein